VITARRHAAARRTVIGTIVIVLTAGIGLAACGDDDGDENNDAPTPSTEMMDDMPPSTEMMDDMPPSTEMMDDTTP
jgi:hypothetical protein